MTNFYQEWTPKKKMGMMIRKLRYQSRLTQEELARKINCDQSAISRVELGNESIDIEIYELAFKYFDWYYIEEKDAVEEYFQQYFPKFLYYDDAYFQTYLQFTQPLDSNNIYTHVHRLVLLAGYYFYTKNYPLCKESLNECEESIFMCQTNYQQFYLLIKLGLFIIEADFEAATKVIPTLLETESISKEIVAHFIGWLYFKKNNRSMALKYLLEALSIMKITHNHKRIVRVQIMIISLLVKEGNYYQAISLSKSILTNYLPEIDSKQLSIIYFLLGYSYFLLKEYEEAIAYFKDSLQIEEVDYNHIYYYLLHIYSETDDITNYRMILSEINFHHEESFGDLMIHLYFQSQISKSEKYYKYIEEKIIPLIPNHYEKMETSMFTIELLNFYYETQQYSKYHELSQKILSFFA